MTERCKQMVSKTEQQQLSQRRLRYGCMAEYRGQLDPETLQQQILQQQLRAAENRDQLDPEAVLHVVLR